MFFCPDALPCVRRCSWWVPAVRGANRFFSDAVPCVRRCSWWVPAVRGKRFFAKYDGPSGGSLLSVGGIIIFRVIRRPSLLQPWTQLSAYSRTVQSDGRKPFLDHDDHTAPRAPGWWTMVRPRKGRLGAGEDAAVDARAERSTRVHWFGCGVWLLSLQNNSGCG